MTAEHTSEKTAEGRDILREHEFDGIREYDNPTPGWWHLIFFATVIFSAWYFLFYHASTVSTSVADGFRADVSDDLRMQFAEIGDLKPDETTLVRFLKDPRWLAVGESTFQAQCASCHGKSGEGLIGPNLTDEVYKNVRTIADIAQVVSSGAANGAMPAWKSRLHPNEVVLVASYVASLRGKGLKGKGPEGIAIPPWPEASPASSGGGGAPASKSP